MLLIQNFWDNLETESFKICLRPKGFSLRKNLLKEVDLNNKENINENNENKEKKDELMPIKEVEEIKDNNIVNEEEKEKDGDSSPKRRESKKADSKKRFSIKSLTQSVFGKK